MVDDCDEFIVDNVLLFYLFIKNFFDISFDVNFIVNGFDDDVLK